ncbi:hypothetical protein ZWY2020_008890 [Hordeum vulgare]|nr:hypothetical protein ZWY2020_008890 [Hordeum vulgare]
MNMNLGKRAAEAGSEDPQRKRPHVSEGPNSGDDDFVLGDFVRDVHCARRKDGFPSKNPSKRLCDDGDDDAEADSDGEANVAPKTAPMPAKSGHDDSLSTLKDELGFNRSQSIGVKDLVHKLAELVEEDDHVTVDLPVKWKASGDIVYYRPPAGLCGSFDAGPGSHAMFCEPMRRQLSACDVELPPTRGFTARRMFDTISSSEQTFLGGKKHEEIDELLVKVLKLTEELPTSGDRLRTIHGFFPASHGPREDDIVATHNFDFGMVEGLNIAVTDIRSSFAQLKDSQ